ncbi:MAG: S24/S26 family peptidase [Lachnospiraceae bacterium]|nr:S24/S26 family peptidase [Lachnospiraceae bacterium]
MENRIPEGTIDFETYLKENGSLTYWNRGASMRPLIRQDKDLFTVLPKTRGRCQKYDVVLYKRHNGVYVLHRILKVREDDYGILGDNTYKMEYGITDRDILGVMTAFSRGGKSWTSVESAGYRFYVRFWFAIYPLRKAFVAGRRLAARIYHRIAK